MSIPLSQLGTSTIASRSSKVLTDDNGGSMLSVGALLGFTHATDISGLGQGATSNFGSVTGSIADGGLLATIEATANAAIPLSQKGVASGVAPLDTSAKVPLANLPAFVGGVLYYYGLWNANTNTPTLAGGVGPAGGTGGFYVVSTAGTTNIGGLNNWNPGDWIIWDGTEWDKLDGDLNPVTSVAGRTGAVTLSASDISGLGSYVTSINGLTGGTITLSYGNIPGAPPAGISSITDGTNQVSGGGTLRVVGGEISGSTGAPTLTVASGLTVSDTSSHSVSSVDSLSISGATISGSAGNATLTINSITLSAGPGIAISNGSTISGNYVGGTDISISGSTISYTGPTAVYSAGTGITFSNGTTINTNLVAGSNIALSNGNTISVNPSGFPQDFYLFTGATLLNSSQILLSIPIARAMNFAANLASSTWTATSTATASTTLTLTFNGTQEGTINYPAGSAVGTVTCNSFTASAGGLLAITAPAVQDATLAGVGACFTGTRV